MLNTHDSSDFLMTSAIGQQSASVSTFRHEPVKYLLNPNYGMKEYHMLHQYLVLILGIRVMRVGNFLPVDLFFLLHLQSYVK